MSHTPSTYIPMDRRQAHAKGVELATTASGAALFADISGFTALSELLASKLGPRRGAEELTLHLSRVLDALITELHQYSGSVISFSGDAITCWLDGDGGFRAVACALAMQRQMTAFAEIETEGGLQSLGMKVSVATGRVRRILTGSAESRLIDVIAGSTLDLLAEGEKLASAGEVVISAATAESLGNSAQIDEWRTSPTTGETFAFITGLDAVVPFHAWQSPGAGSMDAQQVQSWLLDDVYKRISQGQERFLAELRSAVTMFIRFSGIDYDADDSAPVKLNKYINAVEAILERYNGSLLGITTGDKGSYLYATFGAPIAHEDDGMRGISAAIEILALSDQLEYLPPMQIGITRGRLYAGSYGGSSRRTYGVIGDTVNLSARLMQHAAPGQILVNESLRIETGATFTWETLPPMQVKGKQEAVKIFTLIGASAKSNLHLIEPRYSLPMVGRSKESAVIHEKLGLVLQGRGQIVGITAEAGMGKSRLASHFLEEVMAEGMDVYAGECQSYGTDTNYLVWQSIWRDLFKLGHGESTQIQINRLESVLEAIEPSLVERLPLLGSVVNLPIPDNELTASFDAKLRKTSLEGLLVECIRKFCHQTPHILLLDDTHWMDDLSRDLVNAIGMAIADLPVMILQLYRPADPLSQKPPPGMQLHHSTEVNLSVFSDDEAEALIQMKIEQLWDTRESLSLEFTEVLTKRAEGNPFYLEELLNYLRDRGITPDSGSKLTESDLPDSLQNLILSRIDQLRESEKITLKVASVIGRLFRAAMVWGVYQDQGGSDQIKQDLQTLSDLSLTPLDLPEPELSYIFKNVLTQQVAYDSLLYATRSELHERIGAYIEEYHSDEVDQYLNILAFHYEHSANVAKKREYLLKAAEAAQAAYANAAAIEYYEKVVALLPPAEQILVLRKLGNIAEHVGEWESARSRYDEALALAEELDDSEQIAWIETEMGEHHRKRGQFEEAATWLNRAQVRFTEADEQSGVARILHVSGILAAQQGQNENAKKLWSGSLAIYQALDVKHPQTNIYSNLGIVARRQGEIEQAKAYYQQSMAVAREINDRRTYSITLNNMGFMALDQGDIEESRGLIEEAVAIARQIGDRWYLGNYLNNLGNAVRAQGDSETASKIYLESLAIYRELQDQWALAYLFEDIACLAALEGRARRALHLEGAAAQMRETTGSPLKADEAERLAEALKPAYLSLSASEQAVAHEDGRRMTVLEAIDYATAV